MGLLYKLDARDSGNIWANTGKTTPSTNGSAVAVWNPSSGSVITDDCTQSTAANQPTLNTDYLSSGKPAVVFDGSDDRLLTVDSAAWDVTSITVIVAARASTVTGDRLFCSKWDTYNWNNGWGLGFSSTRFTGQIISWMANGQPATTGAQLCAIRGTTAWKDSYYNGRFSGSSGASIPANSYPFAIGAGNSGQYAMAIGIHYVLAYDTALTNAEFDSALYDCDIAFGLGFFTTRASGRPSHTMYQQVIG
jgi:hypothetical protein